MIKKYMIAIAVLMVSATSVYAEDKVVTLKVDGMSCSSCPYQVEKALTRVEGVKEATVLIETSEALVTFDDSKTHIAEFAEAATKAGFPSTEKLTN